MSKRKKHKKLCGCVTCRGINAPGKPIEFSDKLKTSFYVLPGLLNDVQHRLIDERGAGYDKSQSELVEALVSLWNFSPVIRGAVRAFWKTGLVPKTLISTKKVDEVNL